MVATFDSIGKTLEVLSKYDVGVPEDYKTTSTSSLKSSNGFIDASDIVENLPKDLSKVTRKKVLATNGIRTLSEETITLEDELAALEVEFEKAIEEIKPDITEATTLDYVSRIDNDSILIDGDMIISNNDLGGAITIELLNAEARGEDIDIILADMELVTEAINNNSEDDEEEPVDNKTVGNGEISTLGTFMDNTEIWKYGGVVYYRFLSNVPKHIKEDVLTAMEEWEKLTGFINFSPCENFPELNIYTGYYDKSCFNISMAAIGNADGLANVGFIPSSNGVMKLNSRYNNKNIYNDNKNVLMATIRHELGHVIGLQHEHQRRDRDIYIDISSNSGSYKKLDNKREYLYSAIKWVRKRVRIWFITFHIYVPQFYLEWRYHYYNQATPAYDYYSVMHYHSNTDTEMTVKNDPNISTAHRCTKVYTSLYSSTNKCINQGDHIPYNKNITEKDISAVKKMYGRGW